MNIIALCKNHGFAEAYLLPLVEYEDWTRLRDEGAFHHATAGLAGDMRQAYPWAKSVLLMIWRYFPVGRGRAFAATTVPPTPNYLASHKSYQALKVVREELETAGIRTEGAKIPLKLVAAKGGVGTILKNTMLAIAPYGSRVVLQALMVDAELDIRNEALGMHSSPLTPQSSLPCAKCHACEKACPFGAIDGDGYHFEKCIRSYMGGAVMEEWVMEGLPGLLGCDGCQDVCPMNARLPKRELTKEEREAFALDKLLAGISPLSVSPTSPLKEGGMDDALALVGKNQKARMQTQAIVLAGKSDNPAYLPALQRLAESEDEAIRRAAQWAIGRG
ncbi:MAG: hypothetical protein FWE69_04960 [Clostridiales bacterium]|nr:hypothetical protein [Clostridiales bacterium]